MEQPFVYVGSDPPAESPASIGGLRLGDAIFRIGGTCYLHMVQATLEINLGRPVPFQCMDLRGRRVVRHVTPAVWDATAPTSLLGCTLSNQLPAGHPAAQLPLQGMGQPGWAEAAIESQLQHKAAHRLTGLEQSPTWWPRCILAAASLLQLLAVLAVVGAPLAGYEVPFLETAELFRLTSLECRLAATGFYDDTQTSATARRLATTEISSSTSNLSNLSSSSSTSRSISNLSTSNLNSGDAAWVSFPPYSPPPPSSPQSPPAPPPCKGWCAGDATPWSKKCYWAATCKGCAECYFDPPPPSPPLPAFASPYMPPPSPYPARPPPPPPPPPAASPSPPPPPPPPPPLASTSGAVTVKFVFTAAKAERYLQLQEVELRDVAGGLVPVQSADNPGGVSPNAQTPSRAIDGDTSSKSSKWLDSSMSDSGSSTLLLHLTRPQLIASYDLWTANDNPRKRDPTSWQVFLQDTPDGPWRLADNRTAVQPPLERHAPYGGFALQAAPLPLRSLIPSPPPPLQRWIMPPPPPPLSKQAAREVQRAKTNVPPPLPALLSATPPSPPPPPPSRLPTPVPALPQRSAPSLPSSSSLRHPLPPSPPPPPRKSRQSPPPPPSPPAPASYPVRSPLSAEGVSAVGSQARGEPATAATGVAVATEAEELQALLLGTWVVSGALCVLSLLGLLLAGSRRGGTLRGGTSCLYLVGWLPASAALGFVCVYAVTFRAELQDRTATAANNCSQAELWDGAPRPAGDAAAAAQRGIEVVTALLLGSAPLLLLGVLCAGQVIGWRLVAQNLMLAVNCGTLLIGLGMQAVAGAMRAASATVYADDALLALGGAVAVVSLLGLLSTRASRLGRCLLPLYMLCLGLIGLCLVALEVSACGKGGVYTEAGLASLDAELDEHWVVMRDDLGLSLSKADFVASLRHHRLVLAIAGGLLLIEVSLLLVAAWILHCLVSQPTAYVRAASEMTNLLEEEHDGGFEPYSL